MLRSVAWRVAHLEATMRCPLPTFLPPTPPSPLLTWPRRRNGGIGRSAPYRAECILPRRERSALGASGQRSSYHSWWTSSHTFTTICCHYLFYFAVFFMINFYYRRFSLVFSPSGVNTPSCPYALTSWSCRVFKEFLLYIYIF